MQERALREISTVRGSEEETAEKDHARDFDTLLWSMIWHVRRFCVRIFETAVDQNEGSLMRNAPFIAMLGILLEISHFAMAALPTYYDPLALEIESAMKGAKDLP